MYNKKVKIGSSSFILEDIMNKLSGLKTDCCGCRGFCCRALFFFKSDGFPYDKPAKRNCKNLLADYRCKIHDQLEIVNYYGCINYDCLGAGQRQPCSKKMTSFYLKYLKLWYSCMKFYGIYMLVKFCTKSTIK